ncbi:Sushi domain containing protein 3 [Dissostichus eleginoides]|uniref:Sushi domain containing protein 3 n=1 Tax=Dissostichus eleginoides TaxID=100907 RepID=A0AAD9CE54_DISEL|nr:Sushi domain containing protein 3 [Dissostichus eleginoides]
MSAATASIADVSRTEFTNKDDSRYQNNSGQAQCAPMTLPALGTQRIIQGNGTTVGTVISLQCPAKHKLVGSELKCIMDTNSTHWVGETYCKPALSYDDFGFRVAVLASIVSAAIILFMSMAFITCCWVDCIREDKRKKQEREQDIRKWEEQPQHQEENRSRYSHKAMCDNMQACRCHQQYPYGLDREYGPATPLSTLPGYDYNQPLLHPNLEYAKMSGLPEFSDPPQSSSPTMNPGLQISAVRHGFVRQYGGRESSLSGVSPSTTDESNTRNINPAKEFSIRIISV